MAGVRVATVTTISLATIAAFITPLGLGAPIFGAIQTGANTEFVGASLIAIALALLADGVPAEELVPFDFDRAFAKLDEIRDDVLFYESFGQGIQLLAQGSVSMVLIPHGRIAVLKDQGLPVELNWNDAFFQWTAAAVPKHAPHSDAAFALVDFMTQPEQQAQFARLTKYGPMNSAALDLLDDTTKEQLPNAHLSTACEVDNEGLAKDYDEYAKRFTAWLAKN
jgi:putative spermidine/putrescine transport system substrate-binding protein